MRADPRRIKVTERDQEIMLERQFLVSFQNLLQAVVDGNTIANVPSSFSSHLTLMEPQLDEVDYALTDAANGWN